MMKRWIRHVDEDRKENPAEIKHSHLPPQLVDELSSILAEALLLDLQAHSNITANSPRGIDRKLCRC